MKKEIKIDNLSFAYQNKNILENVSFTIQENEAVGIIGANGAGKSTLLALLMGLLFPQKGNITIHNLENNKKNKREIRRTLGMVFQNPDDQLFSPTIYEDIAFGPKNQKLPAEEIEKRVNKALKQVDIEHLKDRAPFKLSGGERRAAAIASVLSMEPEILIMDEPTAALDPRSRRRIINLLNEIEHTKIITSHDLDMVMNTCTRVILLENGKIKKDGSAKKILTDEKLLLNSGLELPLSLQKSTFK